MNIDEIQEAVRNGQTVCWHHPGYVVIVDNLGQWFVRCVSNGHCSPLTVKDGELNGKEADFHVCETPLLYRVKVNLSKPCLAIGFRTSFTETFQASSPAAARAVITEDCHRYGAEVAGMTVEVV